MSWWSLSRGPILIVFSIWCSIILKNLGGKCLAWLVMCGSCMIFIIVCESVCMGMGRDVGC